MIRFIFGSVCGLLAVSAVVACSAGGPEATVSTSSAPLVICNYPLETPDSAPCTCPAPDAGPVCHHADDCQGVLPDLCEVCPNGGDGCAHWECVKHQCEIRFCPAR